RPCGHRIRAARAMGSGGLPRLFGAADTLAHYHAAGHAAHHSAAHQSISDADQKLVPRRCNRLPRSRGGVRGNRARADRTGRRDHGHDTGRLPPAVACDSGGPQPLEQGALDMKPVTEGRTAGPSIFRELFSSWSNAVLTLLCLGIAALALNAALSFALTGAAWSGSVEDCRAAPGACWPFIWAKLDQLLAGRYPEGERWRCLVAVLAPLAAIGAALPLRERIGAGGVFLAAVGGIAIGFLALAGGIAGLAPVPAPQWGGLTLTLMIAYTGIAASLPLGILLALARRSSWPVPRYLAIIFIDFSRGVPLVAVLFMAAVMLPLFMRPGVDLEK